MAKKIKQAVKEAKENLEEVEEIEEEEVEEVEEEVEEEEVEEAPKKKAAPIKRNGQLFNPMHSVKEPKLEFSAIDEKISVLDKKLDTLWDALKPDEKKKKVKVEKKVEKNYNLFDEFEFFPEVES